jgi:hypothetical protein
VYFAAGTPGNYQVWRRSSDGARTEQVTTGQTMFVRGVVPGGFALTPDSTAWSLPNPRGDMLPPALAGEPSPTALERLGARKVLVADFFVDPTAMPEPFSILYSHVEGRSNLFHVRLPGR